MSFFVTGTDTDVGKTVASAWLLHALDGAYWKPVQSGLDGETDTQAVVRYSGLEADRFFRPRWELPEPLSPHEAAKRAGVRISLDDFALPECDRPLIVEGAGGLLVPLNETDLMRDLMVRLDLPVVVVARSTLGTINHTLLTVEALRATRLRVAGIIMNGPFSPHNYEALCQFQPVPVIAEIPELGDISPEVFQNVRVHHMPSALISG